MASFADPIVPPSSIEKKDVYELVAHELSKLSLMERHRVNQDVLGRNILAAVEPVQLSSLGLAALDKKLLTMKEKQYYTLAQSLNSPMIKDENFRLKFARADCFDPAKAALRMENYLKFMHDNFGKDGLLRPILLTDLDKAERDLLKSGSMQMLPCRDKAGRRILARIGAFGNGRHSLRNKLRVYAYMMQAASEDEETQKQGCVVIMWPPSNSEGSIRRDLQNGKTILPCLPVRVSATHLCLAEDQHLHSFAAWTLLSLFPGLRARTRVHIGSITENQYKLISYGISSEYLPVTSTGNLKNQNHLKWIAYREAKDSATQRGLPFNGIDCPSVRDVLAGKGPHISKNPANIVFRKMMETRFMEHRDARIVERKTSITWEIVETIKNRGGRFLVKDKSWWVVADPDTAREKVSVAFRDMRKAYTSQGDSGTKKKSNSDDDSQGSEVRKRKRESDEK